MFKKKKSDRAMFSISTRFLGEAGSDGMGEGFIFTFLLPFNSSTYCFLNDIINQPTRKTLNWTKMSLSKFRLI